MSITGLEGQETTPHFHGMPKKDVIDYYDYLPDELAEDDDQPFIEKIPVGEENQRDPELEGASTSAIYDGEFDWVEAEQAGMHIVGAGNRVTPHYESGRHSSIVGAMLRAGYDLDSLYS